MSVSPLLRRKEAAEYLRLKEQTLAAWAHAGRYDLPFSKVGRLAMYKQSDLDRFIASRTVGTAAE